MTDVEEFLKHHGVTGMKWGVRRDKGHEGQRAKTKKIAKLDTNFERNAGSLGTFIKVNNIAAEKANKFDIDRINNKPEYKGKDFNRPSPLREKYYKEHQDAFLKRLDDAADSLGTNASGTRKYTIAVTDSGQWNVTTKDVKHADGESVKVNVTYAESGHIAKLSIVDDTLEQSDSVADFLAHYGVVGMKWGVRKRSSAPKGPADVVVTSKGRRIKTSGGERHPASNEAIKTATTRQKAKRSGINALSNAELQSAVQRMNLEQQYTRAESNRSPVRKFINDMLTNQGKQQANKFANEQVNEALKKKKK